MVTNNPELTRTNRIISPRRLPRTVSEDDRRNMLQAEISDFVADGYHIVAQTEWSAQLTRTKDFAVGWFIFWLFTGFGVLLYPLYHLFIKPEAVAYITIQRDGTVNIVEE